MRNRCDIIYRLGLGLLLLVFLGGAGWAHARTTNVVARATAEDAAASRVTNGSVISPVIPKGSGLANAISNQSYLTFGLDRLSFLQAPLFGNPGWQYLAFILYLVLAFYFSKFLDYIIQNRLKKWAARTETKLDDLILELVHGPTKVISFVILLHIGFEIFTFPVWVSAWISRGLKIVVAVSLTYLAVKFIDLLLGYWMGRAAADTEKSLNEQIYPVLRKALKAFVVLVAVLVTSQNLGVNITSLLASLSIGGLALGLAAQDTLANLFGAIAVYVDKPFRIGERIQLDGGVDGVVETIGLRSTRIRNLEGYLITVPNKTMGTATITNISRRPTIKTQIDFGLTYESTATQIRQALAILDEVFRAHPMTQDVSISFNRFGDWALNLQVVHWWKNTDYGAYLRGMQEVNLTVKQRFEQAGIQMAFPSQTLYLKNETAASQPAPRAG